MHLDPVGDEDVALHIDADLIAHPEPPCMRHETRDTKRKKIGQQIEKLYSRVGQTKGKW